MITTWLTHGGSWKSLTANERLPWKGGGQRQLSSHQVSRWWRNELALLAAPSFELASFPTNQGSKRTLFTLFSIIDRMHRPQ